MSISSHFRDQIRKDEEASLLKLTARTCELGWGTTGSAMALSKEAIEQSWGLCGIHRAMGLSQPIRKDNTPTDVVFDKYVALLKEQTDWDKTLSEVEETERDRTARQPTEEPEPAIVLPPASATQSQPPRSSSPCPSSHTKTESGN
ncbi:hypothetical protein DIPPA_59606 [Diplonema papillatum]|nr:hypothetical protein DIPPA_59606 [Diplonema papillatum]